MTKVANIQGEVFGRLTVIGRMGKNPDGRVMWFCDCQCGHSRIVSGACLRKGDTKSCGCLRGKK